MKLIADSGSTKTSWRIIRSTRRIIPLETSGINPFFRTSENIVEELRKELLPYSKEIKEVHFYGAGIINQKKAATITNALQQIYGEIFIEAHSDVLGAARSVGKNEAGIICILGTGSNACYYDGNEIADGIPPLGFIFGDEGSGAVMGKNLLGDYFKRIMPAGLRAKFQNRFGIVKEEVLEKIYGKERPNRFLAGFTLFLSENYGDNYCREFVRKNLSAFVLRNIKSLEKPSCLPVHFVGTVAFVFQDLLKEVLEKEGFKVGNIIKEPIDGLVAYHQINT